MAGDADGSRFPRRPYPARLSTIVGAEPRDHVEALGLHPELPTGFPCVRHAARRPPDLGLRQLLRSAARLGDLDLTPPGTLSNL